MPKISIIIRTFNEEKHLGNLLDALDKQDFKDFEVIVVDSGSTDKTLEIARAHKAKIIQIESRDFTFGYALNIGSNASEGEYLVFVSAHVIPVDNKWLSNLTLPFQNEKVAMVYGRQVGNHVSKFSEQMDFKRLFGVSPINSNVPLYYANNANSAVRKSLWKQRQFDEYLFGLEDIEWARDMANKGYVIHYEPTATIYHIHEERWSHVLNRYRREAIAAVRIGLEQPPQAKTNPAWMFWYVFLDILNTFPHYSKNRLEEILRFRYYQWKGSSLGWKQGKSIDFSISRNGIFFPSGNTAVVIKEKNKAELEEVTLPEMKPGDVLIKVEYVGVCRTDLEIYEGTLGYYKHGVAHYPIIPGHEFSGTIVKIGSNNKFQERYTVGQRVVGECILSRGGRSERKEVGVINMSGAYSTYIVMPGDALHKVPDTLDSKIAALAEPLAVSLRAIRRIEQRLTPQSRVAVIGAGQIGNFCAQILSSRGYEVDVFDQNSERLGFLKNVASSVHTKLDTLQTYDVIVEVTGSRDVLEKVITDSKVDATLLLLGFPYGDMQYNFEDVVGKEKFIVGSVGADSVDFEKAIELLPSLDTNAFTQKVMSLEEYEKAWEIHRSTKYLKILLKP